MKKITWKLTTCLMAALLLCMPVLTGCDKPEEEPGTTLDEVSEGATEETTEEMTEEMTEETTEETTEEMTEETTEATTEATTEESTEPTHPLEYSAGLKFTSNGDGTCYVSGIGECTDADVVIPIVSPDGEQVTSIGQTAFRNCANITSVMIGDGVTSIETAAFYGCTGLASITLPDSLTSIGNIVFTTCTGLTSVTIPDSVTSIEFMTFGGCTGLTTVTISDSLVCIGNHAFDGCDALTDIHYSGTQYQWWCVDVQHDNNSLYSATIHCTDGDIPPEL
ncbi:MAG: leucine-rich repeat domain-containing protein [Clostridia bacterium]|nr:leucine-rich repeat domain-containing protein [Clostridia bacterium]